MPALGTKPGDTPRLHRAMISLKPIDMLHPRSRVTTTNRIRDIPGRRIRGTIGRRIKDMISLKPVDMLHPRSRVTTTNRIRDTTGRRIRLPGS